MFESLRFSTADAGSTIVATAETDPDFARAAQLLTNGVIDGVQLGLGGSDTGSGFRTHAEDLLSGRDGVDFAGNVIDSIQLRLHDDFRVTVRPGGTGSVMCPAPTSQFCLVGSGTFTLLIVGSPVPEPSAAMLLCIGLTAVSVLRRQGT